VDVRRRSIVERVPGLRTLVSEVRLWREERSKPRFSLSSIAGCSAEALPYPVDMSPLLALPFGELDQQGVPYNTKNSNYGGAYQPTSIAQYGLAQWNEFLHSGGDVHREAFLQQARWLVDHEVQLACGASVWPIPFPNPGYGAPGPWLSALTQGNALSLLVRAYRVTDDTRFLNVARRAALAFELDIFDGGVNAPVGTDGVFFEEVATYPAAHILNGYILALFGVLDYASLTGSDSIQTLADRSVTTLHTLLDGYDLGYWSRYDLLHRRPASRFYHALHIVLLRALARYSGCNHCEELAARWEAYERSLLCRVRYYLASRSLRYRAAIAAKRRRLARHGTGSTSPHVPSRVCVPITAFPVPGGMRGVLAGVSSAMADRWQIEYLTRHVGPDTVGLVVHTFGPKVSWLGRETASPAQVPNVWFYVRSGRSRLRALLRSGKRYDVILPQDGAFTAAFATAVARKAGISVVTMDHGNVTLPFNPTYRRERLRAIGSQPAIKRVVSRVRFTLYLPTVRWLIWTATRRTDRFLVAGDEVQDVYQRRFHVRPERILRYPYMVDTDRFTPRDEAQRQYVRERYGIGKDATVVTMINRLAPEKGMDIALRGIADALTRLPDRVRSQLRVVIAGDGPERRAVERDIEELGLTEICSLVGVASPDQVAHLLGASDIFLYTGTRGTNYSVAVLEAMAAECAVIATSEPQSNMRLLAEGRGIAIPTGQASRVTHALVSLLVDAEDRQRMGRNARAYVARHHSADALRRSLLRATGWSPCVADMSQASAMTYRDSVARVKGNASS
jgi:glycosyltransferase involved in cell wall biosynthesis